MESCVTFCKITIGKKYRSQSTFIIVITMTKKEEGTSTTPHLIGVYNDTAFILKNNCRQLAVSLPTICIKS